MIRKMSVAACVGAAVFVASHSVLAAEVAVIPRLSAGVVNYNLKWTGKFSDTDRKILDIEDYLPAIAIGGTVAVGNFYFDAYIQQTGDGSDSFDFPRDDLGVTFNNRADFDRRDYALAIGYTFENGAAVFGGYKGGRTAIDRTQRITSLSSGADVGVNSDINMSFESEGPFLGAAYGWRIGSGVLSASVAWAWLDGKGDRSEERRWDDDGSLIFVDSYVGRTDAAGLALNLKWRAPINDNLAYAVSLDAHKYDFDDVVMNGYSLDGDGVWSYDQTVPTKIEEQSLSLRAEISYRF